LSNNKESLEEQQLSFIFDEAIKKLDEVKREAVKKKMDIVIDLAIKLEKIIPQTDTICQTIVDQLDGRLVTGRFIRKCLDKKYKQEHRRKNAEQQNKHKKKNQVSGSNTAKSRGRRRRKAEKQSGCYSWCRWQVIYSKTRRYRTVQNSN
jgi:hypothetical protein